MGYGKIVRPTARISCYPSISAIYKKAASLTERNNRLAHSRNCFCDKILLGYLATSGAKSDIIILLGDPDFL